MVDVVGLVAVMAGLWFVLLALVDTAIYFVMRVRGYRPAPQWVRRDEA